MPWMARSGKDNGGDRTGSIRVVDGAGQGGEEWAKVGGIEVIIGCMYRTSPGP
jgi:hypothetical protein